MLHRLQLLLVLIVSATLIGSGTETVGAARARPLVVSKLKVVATVPVPSQFRTLGVASGEGAVWATDGTATLTRIDPNTRAVVASIKVRDVSLVASGAGGVWAVGSNAIASRIDPQTNKVLATVPVATDPTGIAMGAGSLWVAGRNSQTITRIDTTSNKVAAKVHTPEAARYVAVGAGAVWAVSNETPTLWRINPARNKVVATIALNDTPNGLVATSNSVWVLGATNDRVVHIDPGKNKVRGVIAIPKSYGFIGYGGAIAADANSLWVATLTHLLQLNPRAGQILAAAAIGHHPTHDPSGLTGVSSGPAGVWVGDADGKAIVQIAVT